MASTAGPSQGRAPQNAGSPYDPAAYSDVILRSADLIDFYVLKTFLCYVSPFFKTMFNFPAPETNETVNGLPIIPVTESGETLRLLLDYIYPNEGEPKLDDITLFLNVAQAAQKYCMNVIENRLRKQIVISHLMDSESLRLYAVAANLVWDDVALIAAQQASQIPLDKLTHAKELKNIPGSAFYQFLEYKLRCDTSLTRDGERLMTLQRVSTGSDAQVPLVTSGTRNAQKPFDSTAKADVILRSKDLVDFFVLEDLVRVASLSSPFLDITNPLGITIGKTEDGRPIINVVEDNEVLCHLLGLIYYVSDDLDVKNCRLYTQVALAARRRGMDVIERRLRKQLAASPLLLEEPLRIYIIASALGWDDVAKSAALNVLSCPLEGMTYMQEFDLITGADLHRLVAFRFKCADAACKVITSNSDFKTYGPGGWGYTRGGYSNWQHHGPTEQVFSKLRSCPRGSTVVDAYDLDDKALEGRHDNLSSVSCPTLARILYCRRAIENAVEAAVTEVPLAI
ncbi:hypothetical protein F5887DRAFT_1259183 [Amanita rubescens]|nr:hypothetical protein F5887DRAFT_1259183 [Amanita rubescens]